MDNLITFSVSADFAALDQRIKTIIKIKDQDSCISATVELLEDILQELSHRFGGIRHRNVREDEEAQRCHGSIHHGKNLGNCHLWDVRRGV